jgi:hypothetical protein
MRSSLSTSANGTPDSDLTLFGRPDTTVRVTDGHLPGSEMGVLISPIGKYTLNCLTSSAAMLACMLAR